MRDYYEIGATPIDEPCAATGEEDYSRRARMECRALINQLYRQLPHDAADFIELRIKAHGHDFGTYYEVVAYFDDEDRRAESLAMQAGDELPYLICLGRRSPAPNSNGRRLFHQTTRLIKAGASRQKEKP
jgi:hypothetical protein